MISKVFKAIFLFAGTLVVSMFSLSSSVFAEGDVVCSGKVSGVTDASNSNAGQINFDAHPQVSGSASVVDLSVVGLGNGLAPSEREHAACVDTKIGFYDGQNYEYELQGYAWNTNLGFVSFYCGAAGKNPETDHDPNNAVSPINCGNNQYGVKVGPEVLGERELFGYAWNPVFGYIQMKGQGVDGGGNNFNYGVKLGVDGKLSGYGWSQAGVYLNFSGVKMQLPGQEMPDAMDGDSWCNQGVKPCACAEVVQAENKDYYLHVYLRSCSGNDGDLNGDGVSDFNDPLPLDDYDVSISFDWKDTVKLNQLAGSKVGNALNSLEEPWKSGGAVLYKPVSIQNSNEFLADFNEVAGDLGHYVSKNKIVSYAPTSNENISFTTSTLPPLPFPNELFADELSYNGTVWSSDIEANELILNKLSYNITNKDTGVASEDIIYPNGKDGWSFKFKPIIEFKELYAADKDDEIVHFRNVPVSFRALLKPVANFLSIKSPAVYLILDYDRVATNDGVSQFFNFDFHFLDFLIAASGSDHGVSSNLNPVNVSYNGGGNWSFVSFTNGLPETFNALKFTTKQLLNGASLSAVATLPDYEEYLASLEEGQEPEALPADNMRGPTLYSVISYVVNYGDIEKTVQYYGNKVPRTLSEAVNPSVVVHGNVYAEDVFSPTSGHKVQKTGNVAIDAVRNTIDENVEKQFRDEEVDASSGTCKITSLSGDAAIEGCNGKYKSLEIGEEKVLFFRNKDVELNLTKLAGGLNSSISGKWAIILESGTQKGNLYIKNDIYNEDIGPGNLAIAVMNPYSANDFQNGACSNGNVYINPDVKNIQANIVTDCSVFSYNPAPVVGGINSDGLPKFTYETLISVLNKQLYWQGSVASRNTIGGADLDAEGKDYLLFGTGETGDPSNIEDRLKAQLYDLNYLRMFKLSVAVNSAGLPIDQSCGKALTIQDNSLIDQFFAGVLDSENPPVYGEIVDDDGNPVYCDGIDFFVHDSASIEGDLVPPADSGVLAQGLPEGKYDPVRIDYVESKSFLFKKPEEKSSR